MPPKKPPSNGFYYFMQEFKDTHGRSFRSMKDVADAAGPFWNRMSNEQKKPYNDRALFEKNNYKPGKYTSDGRSVEFLENESLQEKKKIEEMLTDIKTSIKEADANGVLAEKTFFLIHINNFCYCTSAKRYYPAEIAVSAFNLLEGVLPENVFHYLIKPGPLPLGYAGEANTISKESHQICPPSSSGDEENNIEDVYCKLIEFLQSKTTESNKVPVLYCHETYMKIVEDVLSTWCQDFGDDMFCKIYNLQYMFRELKNQVYRQDIWPSDTYGAREIEKDVNAYAKNIACEYHDLSNVPVYCSRSIVVRYAYIICDNCCEMLNIPLVPGQHIPFNAAVAGSTSSASVKSFKSTKSKMNTSSVREDDSESVISVSSKSELDTRSVTSEVSTINDEDEFPSLGRGRRTNKSTPKSWNFSPSDASSSYSQSSSRSYAGATGTSGLSRRPADMPSSVLNRMDNLSMGSSTGSQSAPKPLQSDSDFPSLGMGRGRTVSKRPGPRV